MSLLNQINNDFNQALKSKENERLSVLRLLKSAIKNAEIEKRQTLNDEDIIKIIRKEVKQRKDAAESYQNAGRPELADKEIREIKFFQNYLPSEMTDEELEKIIRDVINETGANSISDIGKVMAQIMPKIAGRTDGSRVSQKVKELLS